MRASSSGRSFTESATCTAEGGRDLRSSPRRERSPRPWPKIEGDADMKSGWHDDEMIVDFGLQRSQGERHDELERQEAKKDLLAAEPRRKSSRDSNRCDSQQKPYSEVPLNAAANLAAQGINARKTDRDKRSRLTHEKKNLGCAGVFREEGWPVSGRGVNSRSRSPVATRMRVAGRGEKQRD